ncbi:MAG: ATP-dependent Clp protease adaptor protein ClpS [Woeseiaceae bacterium]|jgi:ATP-dependent Clp protease adaptor protein ClpS|tara:strand:+ start:12934 stop:13260 length:327 start_codon:yes stop_codon:yes gene_type:complete
MTEKIPENQNEYNDIALEDSKTELSLPSLYKVILINDDYTPMEFVVEVLMSIFSLNKNTSTRVMLDVHTKGQGICGIYPYEIAETKAAQVMKMASENQHPLLCSIEED